MTTAAAPETWDYLLDSETDEHYDGRNGGIRIARRGTTTVYAGGQVLITEHATEDAAKADFQAMIEPFRKVAAFEVTEVTPADERIDPFFEVTENGEHIDDVPTLEDAADVIGFRTGVESVPTLTLDIASGRYLAG